MFSDLVDLFDFDFSSWLSDIVDYFRVYNTVGEDTVESLTEAPWSAFVPWPQVFAFVFLCVFLVVIFRFLRSVLCKML